MSPVARPRPDPFWVALEFEQFPAQVLAAGRRELRGRAFAVVRQSGDSHKAAVYAVSAAARDLGAEPGMPVFVLRRKCGRRVQVVGRDEAMEGRVLARLRELCESWTPSFEVGRWGRALLDLAGSPLQRRTSWEAAVEAVGAGVQDGTGLSEVAAAASAWPLVARALARRARPRGTEVCAPGAELARLAELDLEALPGLAGPARDHLRRYGIETVQQVRQLDRPALVKRLGRADGEGVYGLVRGVEVRGGRRERDEVSAETVLARDVNDDGALRQLVRLTADRVCDQLRLRGLMARRVAVQVTYTDRRRARRSALMPASTDVFQAVAAAALALFAELHQRRAALKAVEVSILRPGRDSGQLDLFAGDAERRQRSLGRAVTEIRRRMGFGAVLPAGQMGVGGMVG